MSKKVITLFTIIAFIIFSLSCYTIKKKNMKTVPTKKWEKIKILGLLTTSGEYIEFSKNQPARIYKDRIVGTAERITQEIKIAKADMKRMKIVRREKITEITTEGDITYQFVTGTEKEEGDIIIFTATRESHESVSVPLSEVELIMVKKFNLPLTSMYIIIFGIGISWLAYLIIAGIGASHT